MATATVRSSPVQYEPGPGPEGEPKTSKHGVSPFDRATSEWEQRARKEFYLIFVFLFDFLGGTRKTKCRVAKVAS